MPGDRSKALTFSYKRLPNGFLRPIIRAEIALPGDSDGVPCEVLIDSGADVCFLKAEIGEVLGLEVKLGETFEYAGINGARSVGYLHNVIIKVKNKAVNSRVVFSYDIPPGGHQVVGQIGFFDNFRIIFDLAQESVVLRPT